MGTTKPLTFLVTPEIAGWPEFVKLSEQKHVVHTEPEGPWWEYDVVMAPVAWRMNQISRRYLELAIKSVREIKYPPKKKG